jgi:hypothetical protein
MLTPEHILDKPAYLAELVAGECPYRKDRRCPLAKLRERYHGRHEAALYAFNNLSGEYVRQLLGDHLDCVQRIEDGITDMFPDGNPDIRQIGDDGLTYRLMRDWRVRYAGREIVIPAGFESDWASVPRWLWWIIPPHQYPAASLLHDFLYASEYLKRDWCDRAFRHALLERGASNAYADVCFVAVRSCGWWVWMRHDPAAVLELRRIAKLS